MVRAPMRSLFALSLVVLLAACPGAPAKDAGVADSGAGGGGGGGGIEPPACDSPKACKAVGFDGVCRSGKCASQVLCADDVECGLGENCVSGNCAFTGCGADSDCSTHRCRTDVFACAECGTNADCPASRPVCDGSNKCVQCNDDTECTPPGPAHCNAQAGGCVHCLEDKHCPNGLSCGAGHVCTGAPAGAACPMGTLCASGSICVAIGGVNTCLPGCSLAAPTCATGQICFKLTFSGGSGLVFDQGGPLGVCYNSQPGLKGYREACTRPAASESVSNCEPNLICVPDTANVSLCRTYCDLNTSGACPAGEKCHGFPGDNNGRLYGLCYPDNGWGEVCDRDSDPGFAGTDAGRVCKASQSCTPYEDPHADFDLSNVCQYSVGAAPGLSPCKDTPLADGGLIKADKLCASGSCQADPLLSSAKFFCYGACRADVDCNLGGRTGTCDGDFVFPVGPATGTVKGCRPACASTAMCGPYGASIVCRSRYVAGYNTSFHSSCAPAIASLLPGAACTQSPQCRSGFCLFDDGRGARRNGYCAEACETASDCQADAGSRTGPLSCAPMTFLGFQGFDGLPNTADDKLLTARLCSGAACAVDPDCSDGGAVCVPDVDPADAGRQLALRCRPTHQSGFLAGAASCTQDSDCVSGVCGFLQAPSTGSGKACFQACNGSTVCPGANSCRVGGMRVATNLAQLSFDSCAPYTTNGHEKESQARPEGETETEAEAEAEAKAAVEPGISCGPRGNRSLRLTQHRARAVVGGVRSHRPATGARPDEDLSARSGGRRRPRRGLRRWRPGERVEGRVLPGANLPPQPGPGCVRGAEADRSDAEGAEGPPGGNRRRHRSLGRHARARLGIGEGRGRDGGRHRGVDQPSEGVRARLLLGTHRHLLRLPLGL